MPGYPETDAEGEEEVEPDDGQIESVQGRILAGAGTTTGPRKTGSTRLTAVDPGKNSAGNGAQAVKLVPHPQPPVALGLVKVNPEPCMEVT
jgi:hypothetical protein